MATIKGLMFAGVLSSLIVMLSLGIVVLMPATALAGSDHMGGNCTSCSTSGCDPDDLCSGSCAGTSTTCSTFCACKLGSQKCNCN